MTLFNLKHLINLCLIEELFALLTFIELFFCSVCSCDFVAKDRQRIRFDIVALNETSRCLIHFCFCFKMGRCAFNKQQLVR